MRTNKKTTLGVLATVFGIALLISFDSQFDRPLNPVSDMKYDAQLDSPTQFVHQELQQLTSPFTRETVIELNEIVARSLAAIEAFDDAQRRAEPAIDTRQARKLLVDLAQQANRARNDMDAAAKRLLDRGERYNEEIFNAMVRFVNRVDQELQREVDLHNEKFVEIDQS